MKSMFVAAALSAVFALAPSAYAQDAAAGKDVFKKCQACHRIGEGAKNLVGPQLNGVVGRKAGGLEDFKYSSAMTEAGEGGLTWNDETLAAYLADPRGFVKGNRMAFAGIKKEEDLANVIAYLKTFSAGN